MSKSWLNVPWIFNIVSLCADFVRRIFVPKKKNSELLNYDFSPIESGKQLSITLQKLASATYKETSALGVEICLYDKDSGRYHQSIVVGKPFRDPIDEALKNNTNSDDGFCITDLIHFAGIMVGAVRCSYRKAPDDEIRDYLKVLVQQINLAVVNCNFVAQMQLAQKSAQDSIRAKTGFLASLSHELRGPLGIILNASEIVRDELAGPVNSQQKDMLSMVLKNGEHLLDLLNDVLDYARIESGKVQPQKTSLEIPGALQELLTVVRVQAHSKKQKLQLQCDITSNIECDRRHFRQVIINLLTNAIKYTPPEGSILVSVEAVLGGKIKITVTDSGCGIAPEDRDKVFSPFERIQKGYAAEQSGTGLGLSLTQKLVQINGGFIDFESSPGKGSSFFVSFNESKTKDDKLDSSSALNKQENVNGAGREVIFIAKETDENKLIIDYLKDKQFVVHAVYQPAVTSSDSYLSASVIILDDSIASILGAEAANVVRRSLGLYSIPLMFLSTKAFEFEVQDMLRNGVDRFISKPCSLKDLSFAVLETIGNKQDSVADKNIVH
jgi:signal transduction histidine kinase/CheY-like chemotaxis protein